jgi:hypothetical protein
LTKCFLKNWKFPNKKGTFDVNLVFTAIAFFKDSSVVGQRKGPSGQWGKCPTSPWY